MSYIKFTSDLLLGSQELGRFQSFINDKMKLFFLLETKTWGLIKNGLNVIGNNFLVTSGTDIATIKIPYKSYAIDSDGNIITKSAEDNIFIPDSDLWYWLRISYQETSIEDGIVSVDSSGNMTGVNTKFKEVLRGLPDAPSKIKFSNASSNTSEYEVVDVISDTVVVLAGNFLGENNLHYKVVGTFTPGQSVLEANKYPFVYDGCLLELVVETVENTAPAKSVGSENKQFYIARVKNTSGVMTIQDKRTEFYSHRTE